MKRFVLIFLCCLPLALAAQDNLKKVAILKTVDAEGNVPYGVKLQLRSSLTYAISHMPGYEAYDRVDMASIMDEQNFQRTGMVSDTQIKKIGEMTGASYVLVAEAAIYDASHIIITAKILDVQTAGIKEAADPEISSTDPKEMKEACIQIARTLLGKNTGGDNTGNTSRPSGQNFTETAFGINMRMVYVEGGTFTMGCTSEQSGCDDDESPTRRTTVNSFYIGMLEVTQSQWEAVMGTTVEQQRNKEQYPGLLRGTGADYPMYYVSWEESKEFCARLSRQTGKTYRLPTEAEWEYAARGGKKNEGTKYSGGWNIDNVAWNSGYDDSTHPCGTKQPNALGIYDMSGNVSEWCEDWYGIYLGYDTDNPRGASSGSGWGVSDCSCRVTRGGDYGCWSGHCRVSSRSGSCPGARFIGIGFRVVLLP